MVGLRADNYELKIRGARQHSNRVVTQHVFERNRAAANSRLRVPIWTPYSFKRGKFVRPEFEKFYRFGMPDANIRRIRPSYPFIVTEDNEDIQVYLMSMLGIGSRPLVGLRLS